MHQGDSLDSKYNSYGILVTVVSLLLLIVYSTEQYDSWDLMVAFFSGYFSISYIKDKMPFDWFSFFASCFIAVASVTTAIISINVIFELWEPLHDFMRTMILGASYHLILILICSILGSFFWCRNNA